MPFDSKDLKESLDFLNILTESLNSAIFIVDKSMRVQALNSLCDKWFEKPVEELFGELCGNAMGCEFTALTGKVCGSTEYCGNCELRTSVLDTFVGESSANRVPLCRRFLVGETFIQKYYLYSTRHLLYKHEEMVLVILDDITELELQNQAIDKTRETLLQKNKIILGNLEMARRVQMELLPQVFPSSDLFRSSGRYLPVEELGGDFYDIKAVSENKVLFFISDVSGHGAPSALIAAMQKPVIADYFNRNYQPGDILKGLNNIFSKLLAKEGYFLTAAAGHLDLEKGLLHYAAAAHPEIIILRKDGGAILLPREKKDYLIGPFPDIAYRTFTEPILSGDIIVLFTDGIIEALNASNELFGYERLSDKIREQAQQGPEGIIDGVLSAVHDFTQGRQEDDITILAIELF